MIYQKQLFLALFMWITGSIVLRTISNFYGWIWKDLSFLFVASFNWVFIAYCYFLMSYLDLYIPLYRKLLLLVLLLIIYGTLCYLPLRNIFRYFS